MLHGSPSERGNVPCDRNHDYYKLLASHILREHTLYIPRVVEAGLLVGGVFSSAGGTSSCLGTLFIKSLFLPFILGSGRYWIKSISTTKTWTSINKRYLHTKIHQPEILFNLSEYKKEGTPPELFMSLVGQIKEKYHNYKYIYTDGSKVEEKMAAAAVTDSEIFVNRLADHSSIFTAETKAISLALDHPKTLG